MRRRTMILGGGVFLACSAAATAQPPTFSAVEIPNLQQPAASFGEDVNDHGVVVGFSALSPFALGYRPWIWSDATGIVNLYPFADLSWFATATAINNNGEVLGFYADQCLDPNPHPECPVNHFIPFGGVFRGVVWAPDGSGAFTEIPSIAAHFNAKNLGIAPGALSNSGLIGAGAGLVDVNAPPTDLGYTLAILWDQVNDPVPLDDHGIRNATIVTVASINDHGQYCGSIYVDGDVRGYVFDPKSGYTVLPRLSDESLGVEETNAIAINNNGQVIGNATLIVTIDGVVVFEPYGAYLWDPLDGMVNIGFYVVHDLNDHGQIVGSTAPGPGQGPDAAMLYDGGVWHEIQSLTEIDPDDWRLLFGSSINNNAQILVNAAAQNVETIFASGEVQPFLLTPKPDAPGAPGDLDGDGVVGVADLLILLSMWGACDDCAPGGCPADLDGDCAVGVSDLLILLSNWG